MGRAGHGQPHRTQQNRPTHHRFRLWGGRDTVSHTGHSRTGPPITDSDCGEGGTRSATQDTAEQAHPSQTQTVGRAGHGQPHRTQQNRPTHHRLRLWGGRDTVSHTGHSRTGPPITDSDCGEGGTWSLTSYREYTGPQTGPIQTAEHPETPSTAGKKKT